MKKTLLYAIAITVMTIYGLISPLTAYASDLMLPKGYMNPGYGSSQGAPLYDQSCSEEESSDASSDSTGLKNVYVLGDSITVGAKDLYESKLKAAGAEKVLVSASGGGNIEAAGTNGTKKSGLDAISSDSDFIKDADTVIIAHGTNQMSHAGSGPNYVEGQQASIKKAIDAVKETGSSAKIYWVDVAISTQASSNVTAYAGNINKAIYGAKSEGYSVISWAKVVDPSYDPENATGPVAHNGELLQADGIHLTGAGNEKLVDTVVSGAKSGGGSRSSSSSSSSGGGDLAGEEGTEGTFRTTAGENKRMQILVHTTEGDTAKSAISTLKARGNGYHTLIEKDGKEIRLIEDVAIAHGAKSANNKSLHVSLVGKAGDGSHFDPKSPQLQTLSKRIGEWAKKYDIPLEKVEGKGMLEGGDTKGVGGHIDIAKADPAGYASGPRSDPGEKFPWDEVLKSAGGSGSSKQDDACCEEGDSSKAGSGADGGGCGDKGYGTGADNSANKQQIWSFLIGNGLSEEAAAGIMGNMEQESNFFPDADNKIADYGRPSAGVGCVGVVQWCFERIDNLVNFAKERGKEWDCLGVQLEFMWHEMSETSEGRMYKGETLSITLQDALNGEDMPNRSNYYPDGKPTPNGAANMFHNYFERANEAAGEHLGRAGRAEKLFEEFTGKSASSLKGGAVCEEKESDSKFGKGIVEAALEMGTWGAKYNACYTFGGGHSDQADLERRIDNHFHGPENGVDCSGFVSAVILKGTGEFFVGSTQAYCDSDRFEKIPIANAEPGDMSVDCGAHIEVITKVNGPGNFETVGSHTTGCGAPFGPSPDKYAGTESFVLRFKGGAGKS